MINYLIMKYQPTLSIDSVETDLTNYEYTRQYTYLYEFTGIIGTDTTLSLPSPITLLDNACFIELICNDIVTLSFNNGSSISLTGGKQYNAEFIGYNFQITNDTTADINFKWRCYFTD